MVETRGGAGESLIAPVEASSTSASSYAIGEQFIYNHNLYKATAAIAVGDTISPGTNCTLADPVVEQMDAALDGKVNEPSTEGTSGQVLVTDGNGGRSWGDVVNSVYFNVSGENATLHIT
jgi:hypothetical protein